MKVCTKCGEAKLATEFGKHAQTRDGLRPECKVCSNRANAAWRIANPVRRKQITAKWRAKNPGHCAEWQKANPNKVRASNAAWQKANPGKVREKNAKWRTENLDKVKAAAAIWQAANGDARRIHKLNRRARANGGKLSTGITQRLFDLQRGKCACGCKQPLGDNFHRDHIMPLALGGTNTDDNIQLLRAACNLQKHKKHPIDFMQQRGFLL